MGSSGAMALLNSTLGCMYMYTDCCYIVLRMPCPPLRFSPRPSSRPRAGLTPSCAASHASHSPFQATQFAKNGAPTLCIAPQGPAEPPPQVVLLACGVQLQVRALS